MRTHFEGRYGFRGDLCQFDNKLMLSRQEYEGWWSIENKHALLLLGGGVDDMIKSYETG